MSTLNDEPAKAYMHKLLGALSQTGGSGLLCHSAWFQEQLWRL